MINSETLSPEQTLTVDQTVKQESNVGSSEPEGNDNLLDGAKNFQHAIQRERERVKALEAQLKEKEEIERSKKLADMSELERYETLLKEREEELGRLKLGSFVRESVEGKELPKAIEQLLIKSPWAIPAVAEELGSEFTWDQAIDSVKRHLPEYVDSLVVKKTPVNNSEEELLPRRIDSERTVDSSVVREHLYTREEVAELAKNPIEYEKHRLKIMSQLQKFGGKFPQ